MVSIEKNVYTIQDRIIQDARTDMRNVVAVVYEGNSHCKDKPFVVVKDEESYIIQCACGGYPRIEYPRIATPRNQNLKSLADAIFGWMTEE